MAEQDEKPFEPTASKLDKARKEGNVARSSEINTTVSFGAGVVALAGTLPMLGASLSRWLESTASTGRADVGALVSIAAIACIPMAVAAVAGTVAGVAQGGGLTFVAPTFKLERLQPGNGFKRMLSKEALVSAGRALIIFAIACAVVYNVVHALLGRGAGLRDPAVFVEIANGGVRTVLGALIGVALVFAILDVMLTRARWLKGLRMDLHELKRELRETQGDPMVKGRRKRLGRAIMRGSISKVQQASFVVTNPTHVAVALRYAPPAVPVPLVLCIATDDRAREVKRTARRHEIPIIENVPLARMLLADARIGQSIPRASFVAVAEIVHALKRSGALA